MDLDPEQIAKNLSKRYGNRAYHKYTGDMNEVPQHFLMPDVDDPNLWLVRVKVCCGNHPCNTPLTLLNP